MRRNNNYFGDVSQFFLKAKKEENFVMNPEIKSEIRKKLSLKIQDLKTPVNVDPVETTTNPLFNFWKTWRYQLVGVPASLFALMIIVFAANNWNFSVQKEDFSPALKEDIRTSVLETTPETITETTEDSPLIAETIVKPKPELLVLNINELGNSPAEEYEQSRTLNTYTTADQADQTETTTYKQQETKPEYNEPLQDAQEEKTSGQTTQPSVNTTVTTPATTQATTPITTVTTTTPATSDTHDEPQQTLLAQTTPPETPLTGGGPVTITDPIVTTQPELTENLAENLPESTQNIPVTTAPELAQLPELNVNPNITALSAPLNLNFTTQINLSDIIASNTVFLSKTRSRTYTINYYTNKAYSTYAKTSDFDKTIIPELIKNKTPTEINVYYISDTQVLVVVKEGLTTKKYLYEKTNGSWTVVKYEKN